MKTILIIEDDPAISLGLEENLKAEGYRVICEDNGETGYNTAVNSNPDLIILDLMLPGKDGLDICRDLRKSENNVLILMLTSKKEEIDKVLGLEFGADDYVTKPFSLRELLARIKAVLRRGTVEIDESSEIKIGNLKIDFAGYKAFIKNEQVQMSHKEFEILNYLWNKKNSTVSRDDLLSEIWGYDEAPTTRTVDNFIVKLRHKIEKDPNHPQFIITVHGIGYKLVV